jgi:hypothetical protein
MGLGSPRKHSFTRQMGPRFLGELHFLKVNGPKLPRETWLAEANVPSSRGIRRCLGQMATSSLRNIFPEANRPKFLKKTCFLKFPRETWLPLPTSAYFLKELELICSREPYFEPIFPRQTEFLMRFLNPFCP